MISLVRRGLLIVLAALALLAALAPAAGARPAGRVQAFLLTTSPDSLRDLKAHAGSVAVL